MGAKNVITVSSSQIAHAEKLFKRVRDASRASQRRVLISQCLNSFDAKFFAAQAAYSDMPPHRRPDRAKLEKISSSLSPFERIDEPVLVHWKEKDTPPYHRPILEFGIGHRTLQNLVRQVLAQVVQLHVDQYLLNGGTHAAISQAANALSQGLRWAVEIDITNCYQSFDGIALKKLLPIPKEVTENIILSQHLNLLPGNIWQFFGPEDDCEGDTHTLGAALSSARQGIPQGSATSPLVAEAMIAIALTHIPKLGVIVAYADNVLLLAKSKSDVVSMALALLDALDAHPVGRLRPRLSVYDSTVRVGFLGHSLAIKNGIVRIMPNEKNRQKFECKVKSELAYLRQAMLPIRSWRKRCKCLEAYIRSWTAAFKLCDGIQSQRNFWLGELSKLTLLG